MPHDTRRHKPKRKKPQRRTPLGISDPETLRLHRELAALRIAGGAKPGLHKQALMAERFAKLDESERACAPTVTEVTSTEQPEPCVPDAEEAARRINAMPNHQRLAAIKAYLLRAA